MYDLDIEFLNDNGLVENLTFQCVTYVCFKYYNISFYLAKQKQSITIQNVLSFSVKKV